MGALGQSFKLASLWRVVREMDLQAVRQEALAPFDLLIVSDSVALAETLRSSLSPGSGGRSGASRPHHPWVRVASLADADAGPFPNATLVVTSQPAITYDVELCLRRFRDARTPVVGVHVSPDAGPEGPRTPGYVTIGELDAAGVDAIGAALIDVVTVESRLPFAHQLPACRRAYFEITIEETSRANATYALTTGLAEVVPVLNVPLNLGDMVMLTKNQLLMAYRLVLASGRDGDPRTLITELIGVLGGGFLFRQLARQLVGLIPVAGLVPKVAIAYGGTWAIGRAVTLWLTDGRAVTGDLVRSLAGDGIERGRAIARELIERARTRTGRSTARWSRAARRAPPDPPAR